jgi:hypothetical protein
MLPEFDGLRGLLFPDIRIRHIWHLWIRRVTSVVRASDPSLRDPIGCCLELFRTAEWLQPL